MVLGFALYQVKTQVFCLQHKYCYLCANGNKGRKLYFVCHNSLCFYKKSLCLFGLTEVCEGLGQHDDEADRNVYLVGTILNLLQCTIT